MPTKKDLKNYYEKYGDIPKEFNERILFIINNFKLTDKHLKNIRSKIKSYRKESL